jgi:hypothetical protein
MDYDDLDKQIDALNQEVQRAKSGTGSGWKEVWTMIKTIGSSFKGIRYPTSADREAAWIRFEKIVEEVKANRVEHGNAWKNRSSTSERVKNELLRYAELADRDDVITAGAKGVIGALSLGLLRESEGEGLHARSRALKSAWERFGQRKDELLARDKREVFDALQRAKERLDRDWTAFKQATAADYESKRRQREEKRKAFEDRAAENIAKLVQRLGRLYGVLEHKEQHLNELHGKRDAARSDKFRAVVEGWIDEEETAIGDIRAQIRQLEEWAEEARRKLR